MFGKGKVLMEKKKKTKTRKLKRKPPTIEMQQLQFNTLIESNHEFFGLAELDGTITYINRAGRMMCGLPLTNKLPPLSIKTLVPESFRRKFQKEILPAVKHNGRWQGEALLRRLKDKAEIPIDISVFIVFHPKTKKLLSLATIIRDITERKLAEEALRESEERLKMFTEASFEGICIIENGRVLEANEQIAKMMRCSVSDLFDKQLMDFVAPESRENVQALMQSGSEKLSEQFALAADGTKFPVEVRGRPLFYHGRHVRMVVLRDIMERKHSEEALRQSEERLRKAQTLAHVGNWELDLQTKKMWASEEAFKIYGFERSSEFLSLELVQQSVLPEYRPGMDLALHEFIENKQEYDQQFKIKRVDDGQERFIHSWAELVVDQNGAPIKANGVIQDITERMQAEEALIKSEKRFRQLSDLLPQTIFEADLNGNLTFVNQYSYKLFSYLPEDFQKGLSIFSVIAPQDHPRVRENILKVLSGVELSGREYLAQRKDGTTFPLFLHSAAMMDSGVPVGIRGIAVDMTDRKQAENALRESEERFRTTLYSIGDGVITTDTLGIVQQMNHVAEGLTGWKEAEACGKSIEEIFRIFREDTNAAADNPVATVLKKGIVVELVNHTVLEARDGTRRPVADSGAPIRNSKGEITGVVLVFNDQTERRGLQDQLLQAQKMDAIGRLAGGVAHDFNNMIGVILGYAMMLEKKIDPADPSYKKVKSIISAAERSANLTKQLLAFARKQIITPVPLNLNEELSSLQKMLGRLIGEDIALKVPLEKDLWNIKFDPTQIAQIMTNLATNARDAIENIGEVTIETANVKIEETPEAGTNEIPQGEYVLLMFSDTGKGMDKETLSHIFEPFFTTKPKGEGIGLGLSTVFGIVKQNNGFINVYSEPGQGTNIKIYFPRYYGTTETPDEQLAEIPLTGTETILIVEDEAELLNLAVSALEIQGYKVLGAQFPSEALSLCEMYGHKIDLLITDVIMPGMNGKELKDRIHALQPSMKSIFMSGYTADIVTNRGILEEGVQFIQKPFTPALLARMVRETLNG